MDQRPKYKRKNKTLRRKHKIKASQQGFGSDFLDMTKAQIIKEKIDQLGFVKILKLCASKDTIDRVKSQPIKWEKVFANYVPNKKPNQKKHKQTKKTTKKQPPPKKTPTTTNVKRWNPVAC